MNSHIEIRRDRLVAGQYFEDPMAPLECSACTLGQYVQQLPDAQKILDTNTIFHVVLRVRVGLDLRGINTEIIAQASDAIVKAKAARTSGEARIVREFAKGGIAVTFVGEYRE